MKLETKSEIPMARVFIKFYYFSYKQYFLYIFNKQVYHSAALCQNGSANGMIVIFGGRSGD